MSKKKKQGMVACNPWVRHRHWGSQASSSYNFCH